ncbi:MAG: DMT family transporter, partial [Pseudomonadota bacterium]
GARRSLQLARYGAPFVLLVGGGLQTAPVAHAGVIVPGLMPVFAALLGAAFFRERLPAARMAGFALIILAVALIALDAGVFAGGSFAAHSLFIAGAFGWAVFTVTARPLGQSPYLTTALVGAVSAVWLAPAMLAFDLSTLAQAGWGDAALHAAWQGLLSGLLSVYAYGRAIEALGASQAAALAALVPFVATAMAAVLLDQTPGLAALLGLIVVGAGVYLAVGAPPPRLRRRAA